MRDHRETLVLLDVANNFLGVLGLRLRSRTVTQHVHLLIASELKPAEKQEPLIGKRVAFAYIVREFRAVETFRVIGRAYDGAAVACEEFLQLGKRKFAGGIGTVNVESGFQHGLILIASPVLALAESSESSLPARAKGPSKGNYHGTCRVLESVRREASAAHVGNIRDILVDVLSRLPLDVGHLRPANGIARQSCRRTVGRRLRIRPSLPEERENPHLHNRPEPVNARSGH